MVCKRPEQCQGITKAGTRCKNCVGAKGTGGYPKSHCTACHLHAQRECKSKEAKRAIAQNRAYKNLQTSNSYATGKMGTTTRKK